MNKTFAEKPLTEFAIVPQSCVLCKEVKPSFIKYTLYHYFVAKLRDRQATEPTELDLQMEDSEWVPIEALDTIEIRPQVLGTRLHEILSGDVPVWLGTDYVE